MDKEPNSKKRAMMNVLRISEKKWLLERALRLKKYKNIFIEECLPLSSTVSIMFFDEIMYDYVYGAYVSCIVMCHLVCMEVLKAPFSVGLDEKLFTCGFSELIMENKKRGWIDNELEKDLIRLNKTRNNLAHSKSSKKVIKKLDMGDYTLAKLYDPNFYSKLEREAIFAMKLVHTMICDTRLRFAP